MTSVRWFLAAILLWNCTGSILAKSSITGVYTPPAGTSERRAITDALRAATISTKYKIHELFVFHGRRGGIAYMSAEPFPVSVDGGSWVLTRAGNARWKVVWGIGGGGSNSCQFIADEYDRALRLAKLYGVSAIKLMPGVASEARDARATKEGDCVGDVWSGG